MSKKKTHNNEFLYNPLFGLMPIILVSILEIYVGLNIAMHFGILASIIVLMRNYFKKEYSNQPIILFFVFVLALYQYMSVHVLGIKDGSTLERYIYHGIIVLSLVSVFFTKNLLHSFFNKHFAGSSKHLENNLREFYFIATFILIVLTMHMLVDYSLILIPRKNAHFIDKFWDNTEVVLLVGFVVYEIIRIRSIEKKLATEEFWPIVNNSGIVIGKVAKSVSLIPSKNKELHPIVRVHFIHDGMVYLFKAHDPKMDTQWDCTINEHVLYGETMEQTISRVASHRYGIKSVKPNFLLKHIVEEQLENQYILLYYISNVENLRLANHLMGQLKPWPIWQIEENLQKDIFSEAFKLEYEYIKNTVLLAEQFSKVMIDDEDDD
jgi:hypothetical protein